MKEDGSVLDTLIPKIIGLALEISRLFPDGTLQILRKNSEDKLELSRKQVKKIISLKWRSEFWKHPRTCVIDFRMQKALKEAGKVNVNEHI